MRKRDRWGATEQVESTIEPSTGPSLYNDTLHCAINKSMGNTCSALLMMEILARHYFAALACIDKITLKLNFPRRDSIRIAKSQMPAGGF